MLLTGLLDLAFVLVAVFSVLMILSKGGVKYDWDAIPIVVALIWNGVMIGGLIENVKEVVQSGSFSSKILFRRSGGVVGVDRVYLAVSALTGVAIYAAYVFPAIPQEFGGGRKPFVKVILAEPQDAWRKEINLRCLDMLNA